MSSSIVSHTTQITMSSREIAVLVESRHDSVRRTMERLQASETIQLTPTVEVNPLGQSVSVYLVNKRDSYIVVAQLSPEFTARLVDRWQELEAQTATDPMKILNDPEAMRGLLLGYTEKVIELQGQVSVLEPKAKALDRISDTSGSLNVTEAAKALGLQPKHLFAWLFQNRWTYRRNGSKNWLGYQDRCVAGLLEHKVASVLNNTTGEEVIREQVRITPKGLARLATLLESTEVT